MTYYLKYYYRLFICLGMLNFLLGSGNATELRQYEEVFIDVPQKHKMADSDPHAFMGKMPQDDIHSNLNLGDKDLQAQLNQSVAPGALNWVTPNNWLEKKETSGMRLASFMNKDTAYPIETTIVSLAGKAGGVSANVTRWMQQIKLAVPSMEELENFVNQQEKLKTQTGADVILIDLTKWQKETEAQAPSMIAAIIEKEDSQIFVKMTGSRESVIKNKDSLRSLVLSIQEAGSQK
ncbi:MAG: hypothetical protein NUV91_02770 [Candidatus Omnitrophica bacterium]|nr:hypothetical protein [Candidatus Omnitrophota bacterium]